MGNPVSIIQAVYRFIVQQKTNPDPRSTSYLKDAHALGLSSITGIQCEDLYFLQGNFTSTQLELIANQLLHNPITQSIQWERLGPEEKKGDSPQPLIEVALRPGVTDPVAGEILRAGFLLGLEDLAAASTGLRFTIQGDGLTDEVLSRLATRLLCNPVIQRYVLGKITPSFQIIAESSDQVEIFPLRDWSNEQLMQLSRERRAALDLNEMQAIQAYCQFEKRDLTDIEFEMIAQTWSEHCVHKTFKARVIVEGEKPKNIDNLFKHTIREATRLIQAPWVRSAFTDNAGIIDYDGVNEISFKVETHNHPSAIEPFGGANTGIGGVIRDIIGVSARPIGATDILCFGPANLSFTDLPAGVLHPRRIASGVVAGIQDYGNKIGIPTVNGAVLFDPGYTSNPLVFCGCVGIAPIGLHTSQPQPGDRIIVIGGRTGRDGLRGATFSSMTMDAQTGEVAGASVQIGAPIVEKGLIDVTLIARDRRLYHAITDCGAGGLSSAVGEMASKIGGLVQIERVPLKYPGLAPWEVWLSEAQERMVFAVPPHLLPEFRSLCDLYEVELTDIGEFSDSGRLTVCYQDQVLLDLENHFLHEGIPQRQLLAELGQPKNYAGSRTKIELPANFSFSQTLLGLLAHPNIASKEKIIRVYDHEVQGGTVIKPLVGIHQDGPSDACVLRPIETQDRQAVVLSAGINPEYGKLDPYQMAVNVIDEALRNAVAVGADPQRMALLDNFCWGDPTNPRTMGDLVLAATACRDAAVDFKTPFISGKDSFNNEYWGNDGLRHAIPPTLLISGIGVIQDWSQAVSMDLKQSGDRIYLIGPFKPVLGGSHFSLVTGSPCEEGIPSCQPPEVLKHYLALHEAILNRQVRACHDLSEGGLAVAAAEMCIGGRLGLDLELQGEDPLRTLFGETTGCLLVEIAQEYWSVFEADFEGLNCQRIGLVCPEPVLSIRSGDDPLIHLPVPEMLHAWHPEAD
jgi:phosphoribosylformylglycinamidine synthase subunit PurSL